MSPRILYWCHDTIRLPYETGIQRVVRRLGQSLVRGGTEVVPVGWDWRTHRVKALNQSKRSLGNKSDDFNGKAYAGQWLLIPELTLELAGQDIDPVQIGRAYGFKTAAWVHDLIPLKLRSDYREEVLAQYHRYYAMFATADLVFASTHCVANDLREHLGRSGSRVPEIAVVPFAAQFAHKPRQFEKTLKRSSDDPLKLLSVSTWEPRKNHPRLLKAIRKAELLSGLPIELSLVGQKGHFSDYDAEVEALVADMPNVIHHGSVCDDQLNTIHQNCHASIYPSYEEGFGLPIAESLWLATPCLCHEGSSMAEVAPGGGVLVVDMTDEEAIVRTLQTLAKDHDLLNRLSAEAIRRPLTSWDGYAGAVMDRLWKAS